MSSSSSRHDDDVIIPCLYNSFSFTPENNAIVYYECYQRRRIDAEPVVAVAVAVTAKAEAEEADFVSVSSESLSESSDSVSSSSSSSSSEQSVFHPEMMARYAYTPIHAGVTDTLLWLIYVMLYGAGKYETIENHYTEANRIKFEWIETLRESKSILKANKIKLSETEETLVHKPFITLETLRAIAVCKGLSVCFVHQRKYFRCDNGNGSGGGSAVIIEKINGKYVLYLAPVDLQNKYLNFITANYWLMESISAPIRPISAYKLADLVDISTRLGLPTVSFTPGKFGSMGTEKRKTKPELYEAIKLKVYL